LLVFNLKATIVLLFKLQEKLINSFMKSEFSRNVFTLVSGTAIAQFISIAASLIISRLYTPDDFGVFTIFISIASLISLLLAGRYELAINLPKSDNEGLNVLGLSIKLNLIISFFLTKYGSKVKFSKFILTSFCQIVFEILIYCR
jgi:hypothetical protein